MLLGVYSVKGGAYDLSRFSTAGSPRIIEVEDVSCLGYCERALVYCLRA